MGGKESGNTSGRRETGIGKGGGFMAGYIMTLSDVDSLTYCVRQEHTAPISVHQREIG